MAISSGVLWAGILGLLLASAGRASAREPVPFSDAYRDGYALVTWREVTTDQVKAMVDRIRKTGATHLIIPYFGCQTDIHSADVGSCVFTRGEQAVAGNVLARMVMAQGFTDVSYLPIVETPDGQWRGLFDPKDVAGWFKTYTAWIKGIARDAKALGMKELVVGTEMTQLYRYEAQWRQVLAEVRTEFSGPLILTMNWGDTDHAFFDDVDAIGVSAYYPLSDNPDPSQAELDAAWSKQHDELVALSRKWHRPLHVTEVGYASVTSAAKTPWAGTSGDKSDFDLQARCYESFRRAWAGDRSLVRANVWATEAEDPALEDYLYSFETIGKPAEQVLRRFFSQRLRRRH
jgi:hypothetical protein